MKSLLISFYLLFVISGLNAQIDSAFKKYIYAQIRKLQPDGTIYYADQPEKGLLLEHVRSVRLQFKSPYQIFFRDTPLVLTSKERKFILSEMQKLYRSKLPDNLFPDSKIINSDSIVRIVDRLNTRINDSILNLLHTGKLIGKDYRYRRFWSFSFTLPIFLRNNTLMIYYFMYYAANGGSMSLAIYRKKEGKWTKWIPLAGGDW